MDGFVAESLVRLFGNQQILVLDVTRRVEAICEGRYRGRNSRGK